MGKLFEKKILFNSFFIEKRESNEEKSLLLFIFESIFPTNALRTLRVIIMHVIRLSYVMSLKVNIETSDDLNGESEIVNGKIIIFFL